MTWSPRHDVFIAALRQRLRRLTLPISCRTNICFEVSTVVAAVAGELGLAHRQHVGAAADGVHAWCELEDGVLVHASGYAGARMWQVEVLQRNGASPGDGGRSISLAEALAGPPGHSCAQLMTRFIRNLNGKWHVNNP